MQKRTLVCLGLLFVGAGALFSQVATPSNNYPERDQYQVQNQRRADAKRRTARTIHRQRTAPASLSIARAPWALRQRIEHIERTWGKVQIVSVCRPGATFNQGGRRHRSYHASCQAVDFIPPRGHRNAVLAYLKRNPPGYVLTYDWSKHLHIDVAKEGRQTVEQKQWPVAHLPRTAPLPPVRLVPLPPERPSLEIALSDSVIQWPDMDFEIRTLSLDIDETPVPDIRTTYSAIPLPMRPKDEAYIRDLDEARRYLVATAIVGGTMARQGPKLAIERLHPKFTIRLAAAVREARKAGLVKAGVYSAYRPPAFGVGGFSDKFNSLHAYGLAVDMAHIGRPRSKEARKWHQIASRHKLYNPYGYQHRKEWNHYQPTWTRAIARSTPLRNAINRFGPVDTERMWKLADALIDNGYSPKLKKAKRGKKRTRVASR